MDKDNFDQVDILIVEDNPNDAELIIRALKRNSPVGNITVVEDGAEAVDFFFCQGSYKNRDIGNKPKVVFLDIKMPKLSGLEVLKIIKSDERTSSIPVVALTSSQEESDLKEAYRLGINSYVVKPMDYAQFMTSIGLLGQYWLSVNKPIK